jgi:flavin reductase (DIM6/NTAB) family NADH-FMN oxidoreductase RutF
MPVTPSQYKDALRFFPAGVTIVTIRSGDDVHGLTVSAFCSVSPEPPLVLVVIDSGHRAHELMERNGATFAVNILGEDQEVLSNRFAYVKNEDRFLEGTWRTATTGAPVLRDALAWLDCTVHSKHRAGTHTVYIGEVQAAKVPSDGHPPLVYWNRRYQRVSGE